MYIRRELELGVVSSFTIVYTGSLASLKMLDAFKLSAFYLRSCSVVCENSGTVLFNGCMSTRGNVCRSLSVHASHFRIKSFLYFCTGLSHECIQQHVFLLADLEVLVQVPLIKKIPSEGRILAYFFATSRRQIIHEISKLTIIKISC